MLYIHDTLELFGAATTELGRLWREQVSVGLPSGVVAKATAARHRLFAEPNDVVREAAIMATPRSLAPNRLLETCRLGMALIFD